MNALQSTRYRLTRGTEVRLLVAFSVAYAFAYATVFQLSPTISTVLMAETRASGVSAIVPLARLSSGGTSMAAVKGSEWERSKVLVFGAGGFKGACLAGTLHHLGAEVHGVTNSAKHPGSAFNLLRLEDLIDLHSSIDVSNGKQVDDLIKNVNPQVVFHLAAVSTVPRGERDPVRCFEVNTLGPAYVFAACQKYGVDRLLICSTDHAPGPVPAADLPLPENYPLGRHSNAYDTSKGTGEMLIRSLYAQRSRGERTRVCITRGANFFGPGDVVERRVVPAFINNAFSRGFVPLTVRKTGRQFIEVFDGVSGYIRAASKLGDLPESMDGLGRPIVPTFHFSYETYPNTDRPYLRVEELASLVATLTETEVKEQPGCVDYKPGENPAQALSCAQTRWLIGWQPSREFAVALADLIEFLRPTMTQTDRIQFIQEAAKAAADRLADSTASYELTTV